MRIYAGHKGKNKYVIFYDKDRKPTHKWQTLGTKSAVVQRRRITEIENDYEFGRLPDPWMSGVVKPAHRALDFWINRYLDSKSYASPSQPRGRLRRLANQLGAGYGVDIITEKQLVECITYYNTAESRNSQRRILKTFLNIWFKRGL